nr:hypothetical protein [Tanacetum cinerariifolium]
VPPTRKDWDLLFQSLFDELLNPPPSVDNQDAEVSAPIEEVIPQANDESTGSPSLTEVDQDAPLPSHSPTPTEIQSLVIRHIESYQKKLNLTRLDTLMRIDELHKFSDGTLNDVRNALNDRLKGIRMQYLPSTIWRKGDKDRAAAMIQAIEKMLKTRRIMRSLEKFVGGRLLLDKE